MIDTHAHYDDDAFAEDLASVLARARDAGVTSVVNAATTFQSIERICTLTDRYDMLYTAIGLHPENAWESVHAVRQDGGAGEDAVFETAAGRIAAYAAREKVVAIGEIGLDYHYDTPAPDASPEETKAAASWDHGNDTVNWPPRALQQQLFRAQILSAAAQGLPVVVHSRDAAEDTLRIVSELHAGDTGCDMHCFGYSKEMARAFLDRGCYLGIGGVSTFKNGKKLKEVIAYAPLDRLLLETDAPYLAPEPYRGKRNESAYLSYVVQAIAQIKGVSPETVMERTEENARRLFRKLVR